MSTFLIKGNYSIDPVTDLEALEKLSAVNFHTAMLLPHGYKELQLAKGSAEVSHSRRLLLDIGETPSKIAKMNTRTIITSVIANDEVILILCANITAYLVVFVDFDTTSMDDEQTLFLHCAARRISLCVSGKPYQDHKRSKKYQTNGLEHFFGSDFYL